VTRLPKWLRERAPWPMDVIRVDGHLHAVVSIDLSDFKQTVEMEPLATLLARHILVAGDPQPTTMADALLEAGWQPPHVVDEQVARLRQLRTIADQELKAARIRHDVARARFSAEMERLIDDLAEELCR
jgi:hypothetical protein